MAYPFTHLQARFQGHFGTSSGPGDYWSFGLRFGSPTNGVNYDSIALQTFADSVRTAYSTFHTTVGSLTGSSCFFTMVECARIGPNGKYEPSGQLTVRSSQSATGGNGTPDKPWNTALVVSLRTANPRGYASNGRVYVPALSGTLVSTTGRHSSGTVQTRVNLFKAFINSCNAAANTYQGGIALIVASATGGVHATVTGIRSDERLDSVERRENDQASVWSTATIP